MKKKITGCVWHGSTVKRERGRERERHKGRGGERERERERVNPVTYRSGEHSGVVRGLYPNAEYE